MEEFFHTYGPWIVYLMIFLGSMVEGESVVLLCSALAYKYVEISLPTLMFLAFLGSLLADQTCFFIGRRYGPSLIEKWPMLQKASSKVFYHLHKHSTLFIFSFRFIYGIRVASPFIIGSSGISVKRFAILNFLAAVVWAVASCYAGYLIGHFFADSIDTFVSKAEGIQKHIVIGLGLIIVAAVGGYKLFSYFKNKK